MTSLSQNHAFKENELEAFKVAVDGTEALTNTHILRPKAINATSSSPLRPIFSFFEKIVWTQQSPTNTGHNNNNMACNI